VPAPLAAELVAVTDRWLLTFTLAVLVVIPVGWMARRAARQRAHTPRDQVRGVRRRVGAVLAVGPVVGFAVAAGAGAGTGAAALGAVGLALFGVAVERRRDADRLVAPAVLVAALGAVAAGVRFAPTGVAILDVVLAVGLVVAITVAFDGLGNTDGLVAGMGSVAGLGLVALAGFAEQFRVADVAAGLLGGCLAFLAYNLPPASLFAGRSGRLATGYAVAVLALSVDTAAGPPAPLLVPLALTAIPLLDLALVLTDRAQRRRPLRVERKDHLVHRMAAAGATPFEGAVVLVGAQGLVSAFAVAAARDVVSVWVLTFVTILVVGALAGYARRAPLERMTPIGLSRRAWWLIGGVLVFLAGGVLPLLLDMPGVTDTMLRGRDAAQRALHAARRGDAATAEIQFRRAAHEFEQARDQLHSKRYEPARLLPVVAPNLRAARVLADIGYDLARNGEIVTATVVPESLAFVDGGIPMDEVRRITPALVQGAETLARALERLRDVADEPYLLPDVRNAVDAIRRELARGAREARNTADAARLAPAIFGADGGERRYLLVVQNPTENRGTGGLIGSYGVVTVRDGVVSVGEILRTGVWNHAVEEHGAPEYESDADYRRRYAPFRPEFQLQAVNLSPDFPTVGRVLASLAPEGGVGDVDGVIAVDPEGLAALLSLTGPVPVPGWPEDVMAGNVVDITLRDAYTAFAQTPERAEFLGDVARAVVAQATSGRLGEPAAVARVLGDAARQGHVALSFRRAAEQRLALAVGAAGAFPKGGHVLHVSEANIAANKIDYYLEETLDYRVVLHPDDRGRGARAVGTLGVRIANTAPRTGLPQIVAGPYEGTPDRTQPGESMSYVSVYTPLALRRAAIDGDEVATQVGEELGMRVYSTIVRVPAQDERTLTLDLAGRARLARGGWYVLELANQPMVNDRRARISVSVPDGYRIVEAPRLQHVSAGRASGILVLDRPTTVRVRIERSPGSLWSRLDGAR
jgi:UDP-N-acetylmuramyl pentapeptide phosphotransferase/UDP-N-acetylglucosamine-1-phosphate transferase